jgi:hypothetical protein
VERSGCGRAERVPPHRADVGEPNADDPEGGADYLTREVVEALMSMTNALG